MFANRSVVEVVVLVLTFTAAVSIISLGAVVAIVEITDPATDTSAVVGALLNVIIGIVGALFGLLAGKAEATQTLERRPGDR